MDFRLIITAESPLSFSQNKPGGIFQSSLPYVPGSALRGALAGRLLRGSHAAHKDHQFDEGCGFCQVFLGPGAAVFTNAYPARDPGEEIEVLPATAVSCKQKSGFLLSEAALEKEGDESDPPHGVFDTLIDRLCWETLEPAGLVYHPSCPVCRERVEAYGGFYTRHAHGDHADHYHKREVDQRLLTRVAINRRRMVAEDGLLYSPYVISEVVEQDKDKLPQEDGQNGKPRYQPTAFVGHVWGLPEDWESKLESLTAVGGRTSRGLGHVTIQAEKVAASASQAEAVKGRIDALDQEIKEAWKDYQKLGGNGNGKQGCYFTLTLRSDAVLRTPQGLPTMVFDRELLQAATGIEAELVRSYASYHYGGGWQSAWGLPKPAQVLTRAGSVYVYRVGGDLAPDAYAALAELERRGIGELTPEGYGQVRVADAFHLKRRQTND